MCVVVASTLISLSISFSWKHHGVTHTQCIVVKRPICCRPKERGTFHHWMVEQSQSRNRVLAAVLEHGVVWSRTVVPSCQQKGRNWIFTFHRQWFTVHFAEFGFHPAAANLRSESRPLDEGTLDDGGPPDKRWVDCRLDWTFPRHNFKSHCPNSRLWISQERSLCHWVEGRNGTRRNPSTKPPSTWLEETAVVVGMQYPCRVDLVGQNKSWKGYHHGRHEKRTWPRKISYESYIQSLTGFLDMVMWSWIIWIFFRYQRHRTSLH